MLNHLPRDPRQLLRFPCEHFLGPAQEFYQRLLLVGVEIGTYGEGGTGGPILLNWYLLGFRLVLGEHLLLLGRRSLLGLGGVCAGRLRCCGCLESEQSILGIPSYGEDAAAPGQLHEVVGRMIRRHELGQSWVPENGVVREVDAGDVKVDQLGAVVVTRAEGDGKADLSQRAGSATTNS